MLVVFDKKRSPANNERLSDELPCEVFFFFQFLSSRVWCVVGCKEKQARRRWRVLAITFLFKDVRSTPMNPA